MARSCGHGAPNDERRLERYNNDRCPICDVPATRVNMEERTEHIYCECCDDCWMLVGNAVVWYTHD